MSELKNTKCFILNPYTKTLEMASIQPDYRTLSAILGAKNIATYKPKNVSYSVLHNKEIWNKLTGTIAGTKFKKWESPLFGILILIAPKQENSEEYRHAILAEEIDGIHEGFETAKVQIFKYSSS